MMIHPPESIALFQNRFCWNDLVFLMRLAFQNQSPGTQKGRDGAAVGDVGENGVTEDHGRQEGPRVDIGGRTRAPRRILAGAGVARLPSTFLLGAHVTTA